jgi:hypothetical protein
MRALARRLLAIERPRVSRNAALSIAGTFFRERGVPSDHPIVMERLRHWQVLAQGDAIGSPWVLIDNQTGAVTKSGIPPR